MATVLIRHRVENYERWKKAYDDFAEVRRSGGEQSYAVYGEMGDDNNVYAMVDYATVEEAHAFFGSEQLKSAMGEAGVTEAPDIVFLNAKDEGSL